MAGVGHANHNAWGLFVATAIKTEFVDPALATRHPESLVVRFAGDSGDGMQLTGGQFTLASALAGNDFATFPDFPAEIRAPQGTTFGVSAFQVHLGSLEVMTAGDEEMRHYAVSKTPQRSYRTWMAATGRFVFAESFETLLCGLRFAEWRMSLPGRGVRVCIEFRSVITEFSAGPPYPLLGGPAGDELAVHDVVLGIDAVARTMLELERQVRNWYHYIWLSGDHINEQHIHNIDVINWFKGGHPVKAQGMGGREVRKGKDHGEIFDHHFVEFHYADGSILNSQCRHIPKTSAKVEYIKHQNNRKKSFEHTNYNYDPDLISNNNIYGD
jgi:hypothetical protein